MMRLFLRLLFALPLTLTVCACTIQLNRYETVTLEQGFTDQMYHYPVKAPTSRYRAKHFNREFGRYQTRNTNFGESITVKLDDQSEGYVSKDTSFWNSIFKRRLELSKIDYRQYPVQVTQSYSYELLDDRGQLVQSDCRVKSQWLKNEEKGNQSISLSFDESTSDTHSENLVSHYGEWLGTQVVCQLKLNEHSWEFISESSAEGASSIIVSPPELGFDTQILSTANTDERWQSVTAQEAASDEFGTFYSPGDIPGVSVTRDNQAIGAISLVQGNSVIWLSQSLTDDESSLLASGLFSLLLKTWMPARSL